MFVVMINSVDRSCHSQESDALVQKQRFIDWGTQEEDITIVQKDTYEPTQE